MSSPLQLIQILPLPREAKLTNKKTTIAGLDSQNIKDYTPNGDYIVSSSSVASDDTAPHNAFNDWTVKYWQCDYKNNPTHNSNKVGYTKYTQDPFNSAQPSSYRGGGTAAIYWSTKIGTSGKETALAGEWIQVQLPYQIYLYKYIIQTPGTTTKISTFPTKFTVVGSNDGKTWSYIDQQNLSGSDLPSNSPPKKTLNINSTDKFSYFRLIISEMNQGMNVVRINKWNLFGMTDIVVNPNVGTERFTPMLDYGRSGNFEPFDGYMTTSQVNAKYGYNPPPVDEIKLQTYINAVKDFQVSPTAKQASDYSALLQKIDTKYQDLSSNILKITNTEKTGLRDKLMADSKYDFSGNILNYLDGKPTLEDAVVEDTTTMIMQQNSVFNLAGLACASLLIFAIMLARN